MVMTPLVPLLPIIMLLQFVLNIALFPIKLMFGIDAGQIFFYNDRFWWQT